MKSFPLMTLVNFVSQRIIPRHITKPNIEF